MIITRYHDIEKIDLNVEFLTPTFLGGADQQAELRSAPFKNLLRQWWRVVHGDHDVNILRAEEGLMFGSVLDDSKASSSTVRISLTPVSDFKIIDSPFSFGSTSHPEVKGGMPVKNSLYLGYGPVRFAKPEPTCRRYIAPGSKARLSLSCKRNNLGAIVKAIQYMDAFGTIGSRSRNGFGSLSFVSDDIQRLEPASLQAVAFEDLIKNVMKPYPHCFGKDDRALLAWESRQATWEAAMQLLAQTYLRTRTSVNIAGSPKEPHERHALGYPVTNHNIQDWDRNGGRMPSQIRLMVKRDLQGRLVARILHLPHILPKEWPKHLNAQHEVWRQVHQFLDAQNNFERIGGAA